MNELDIEILDPTIQITFWVPFNQFIKRLDACPTCGHQFSSTRAIKVTVSRVKLCSVMVTIGQNASDYKIEIREGEEGEKKELFKYLVDIADKIREENIFPKF